MAYIMVDVESDGPIPGDYSMISFGAILVNEQLDKTFTENSNPFLKNLFPGRLLFRVTHAKKRSHLKILNW